MNALGTKLSDVSHSLAHTLAASLNNVASLANFLQAHVEVGRNRVRS